MVTTKLLSFLYSYIELFSFCGLKGIWCVTIPRTIIPCCFIHPRIKSWSMTSSLDFLFYFDPYPILDMFLLISIVCGDPFDVPFLLPKTCCNSFLVFKKNGFMLSFFYNSIIFLPHYFQHFFKHTLLYFNVEAINICQRSKCIVLSFSFIHTPL